LAIQFLVRCRALPFIIRGIAFEIDEDATGKNIDMERNVNNLTDHILEATDGEIGKVKDFYFDDETWTIRYLVVTTGEWMSGRKVLISPLALVQHSWASGIFRVNLNTEQVRNSPDIDTDKPVSRQQEGALADYYPWAPYWGTGFYQGGVWGIISPTPSFDLSTIRGQETKTSSTEDQHLRSCKEVTGYRIHTADGDFGRVNDFVMDDKTWQISYLVVDTHNWIGGKKVLVAVRHIKEVQWENSKVVADLTVDTIKNSPAIDKQDYILPE
jgi:sporulation protein YlmC with PRC-barrel domain